MNQFSKEQIQKVVLSLLFMAFALYCHFSLLIGPMKKRTEASIKETGVLRGQIDEAHKQMKIENNLSRQAQMAEEQIAWFTQFSKEGAPIAWFPPSLQGFFERYGIKNVSVRIGPFENLPDALSRFARVTWNVEIPSAALRTAGIAFAALENEQPLYRVENLSIRAGEENPEFQRFSITLSTIIEAE